MSNLYQRLCQTGELVSPFSRRRTSHGDHTFSVRNPGDGVTQDSPRTSAIKALARRPSSEEFKSNTRNPMSRHVCSAAVSTDKNGRVSNSEVVGSIVGLQPSLGDDDSLFYESAAACNGDYFSVHSDESMPSYKHLELSNFSNRIYDLRAGTKTKLVGERDVSDTVVSMDEDLTASSEETCEFDICISPNLNLMDSMSFDVASHVTSDDETSLDDKTAMDDEAFQGKLWVDMNTRGKPLRNLSSCTSNKYSKYRDMQTPSNTSSTPQETRICAWHVANGSDFPFPSNTVSSQNYLEMTKKIDEQIQVMILGDRSDMKVIHQQLEHLKASARSLSVPSSPGPWNSSQKSMRSTFQGEKHEYQRRAVNPATA